VVRLLKSKLRNREDNGRENHKLCDLDEKPREFLFQQLGKVNHKTREPYERTFVSRHALPPSSGKPLNSWQRLEIPSSMRGDTAPRQPFEFEGRGRGIFTPQA
jgi:hypothetical protein